MTNKTIDVAQLTTEEILKFKISEMEKAYVINQNLSIINNELEKREAKVEPKVETPNEPETQA